jgi:hypothetical protein
MPASCRRVRAHYSPKAACADPEAKKAAYNRVYHKKSSRHASAKKIQAAFRRFSAKKAKNKSPAKKRAASPPPAPRRSNRLRA